MISLLALLFCTCMFIDTLRLNPPPLVVIVQILCIAVNGPGTIAYFQSL